MDEENISQEFRLKNIDETRSYFVEDIKQNELMSKKHKNFCTTLTYIEHFSTLASVVTGFISISSFAFLVGVPIGIMSSAIGLKICAITAETKKFKSIIKKRKKKHDKIVLLAKFKLNAIEFSISKASSDSNISHDEIVLLNNVEK